MAWQTFWMEPVGRVRIALRRYRSSHESHGWTCEGGWHEAVVWTGEEEPEVRDDSGIRRSTVALPPPEDPRWPVECDGGCGYRFSDQDRYQLFEESLYRRTDTGELRVLHPTMLPPGVPSAGPGAMWDARWMGGPGPDGICLMVRCPRGDGTDGPLNDWPVDRPPSGGGLPWDRTGDPRAADVTAHPSIAIGLPGRPGFYHGWLQGGVLTDHIG